MISIELSGDIAYTSQKPWLVKSEITYKSAIYLPLMNPIHSRKKCGSNCQKLFRGFFSLVLKYPELKDLISTFDGFEGQTNLDPEVSRLYNELQKIKP